MKTCSMVHHFYGKTIIVRCMDWVVLRVYKYAQQFVQIRWKGASVQIGYVKYNTNQFFFSGSPE